MEILFLLGISILAAVSTYAICTKFNQSAVGTSALLSLIIATFFYFFPNLVHANLTYEIPAVFMGGSFIGMTTHKVIPSYLFIALSATIFFFIYIHTSTVFNGLGGSLGTAACIAVLASHSMYFIGGKKPRHNIKYKNSVSIK